MTARERKRLIVIGAGGHGRAVAESAALTKRWDCIAFLDDSFPQVSSRHPEWPLLGRSGDASGILTEQDECIVAIGNQGTRHRLVQGLLASGKRLASVVHPRAWVSPAAIVGPGAAIMAGAVIGCQARVGLAAIVNANATVDHDAVLEDFAHIGVGVQLAGGVIVREGAWLQAGVCAGYGVVVPAQAIVAPGTALVGM